MWSDQRSRFSATTHVDHEGWVRCPHLGCRFEIPVDYEDVARERHRAAHGPADWEDLIESMERQKTESLNAHQRFVADVDADIARIRRWAGAGE